MTTQLKTLVVCLTLILVACTDDPASAKYVCQNVTGQNGNGVPSGTDQSQTPTYSVAIDAAPVTEIAGSVVQDTTTQNSGVAPSAGTGSSDRGKTINTPNPYTKVGTVCEIIVPSRAEVTIRKVMFPQTSPPISYSRYRTSQTGEYRIFNLNPYDSYNIKVTNENLVGNIVVQAIPGTKNILRWDKGDFDQKVGILTDVRRNELDERFDSLNGTLNAKFSELNGKISTEGQSLSGKLTATRIGLTEKLTELHHLVGELNVSDKENVSRHEGAGNGNSDELRNFLSALEGVKKATENKAKMKTAADAADAIAMQAEANLKTVKDALEDAKANLKTAKEIAAEAKKNATQKRNEANTAKDESNAIAATADQNVRALALLNAFDLEKAAQLEESNLEARIAQVKAAQEIVDGLPTILNRTEKEAQDLRKLADDALANANQAAYSLTEASDLLNKVKEAADKKLTEDEARRKTIQELRKRVDQDKTRLQQLQLIEKNRIHAVKHADQSAKSLDQQYSKEDKLAVVAEKTYQTDQKDADQARRLAGSSRATANSKMKQAKSYAVTHPNRAIAFANAVDADELADKAEQKADTKENLAQMHKNTATSLRAAAQRTKAKADDAHKKVRSAKSESAKASANVRKAKDKLDKSESAVKTIQNASR